MLDDFAALDEFSGMVRLFPLPNLAMFPHVDQGLHIFETRYRQMTADALAGDKLITMVMLKPDENWDQHYDGRPPVESTGCLGRIVAHERLADGRYNLRLRGLARLKIQREIADESKLYRLAEGEIRPDICPTDLNVITSLRRDLRKAVLSRCDPTGQTYTQLTALFDGETPLSVVSDLLGYSLPIPLELKQQLLETADVATRVRALAEALGENGLKRRRFPPTFSEN